jgi:hypothetical protein
MKTPYDAAIRWRKSELDFLRRNLAELQDQHAVMQAEMALLEKQFVAEECVAKHHPLLNFAQFATLNRQERTGLQQQMDGLLADIAELSERVSEAYQDFKALDIAARNHTIVENKKRAVFEQSELDEISARTVVPFAQRA